MEKSAENTAGERELISRLAGMLKKCKSILFITGAGISADSGLPTYRGIGGLYDGQLTEDGITVETALSAETLIRRPALAWKYIAMIEGRCRTAGFNRGHEVIAEMEKCFERIWVLTQNIDGFHQAAGSRNVIDIHGSVHELSCMDCGRRWKVKDYSGIEDFPPLCGGCRGTVRPEVVFFGEMLPEEKLSALERELRTGFDAYFSVGTSSVFPYIRQPMLAGRHLGRLTVEINPGLTDISGCVDIRLPMRAAVALDGLWRAYRA